MLSVNNRVRCPAFTANIIDCHVHRGAQGSLYHGILFPTTLDEFIKTPLNIDVNGQKQVDNVKRVLVSSIDGITFAKNEIESNLDMINKFKQDDFYGVVAVCQPSKTNGSADNIRKLLNDYPDTILGLKLHPNTHQLHADSELNDDYLKLAKEKGLPCLFHSQYIENTPNWADPQLIYKLAKRHPDVPIVMGHMGAGGAAGHKRAIDVFMESIKNNDAKLYVDISWVDFNNDLPVENPNNILDVIEKAKNVGKLDRILFGTDAPLGCYGEQETLSRTKMAPKAAYELTVSRIKTAIKKRFGDESDNIIQKIFYDNADELFFAKTRIKKPEIPQVTEVTTKQKSAFKLIPFLGILALTTAIATGLGCYIKNLKAPEDKNFSVNA